MPLNLKIDVSVNGAVCNGMNCVAGLINKQVIISPPPVRSAKVLVIYKHKGHPYKQEFLGDGVSTVFALDHWPDER